MKKKLLFISLNWDLSPDPVGIQNRRIYMGIKNQFETDVYYRDFSSRSGEVPSSGKEFHAVRSGNLSVVDKIIYKLFPSVSQLFSVDLFWWSIICFRKLVRDKKEYDLFYLTFNPFPVFLLGYFFKRKFKSKIIYHFYDPLCDNYFVRVNRWISRLRRSMEYKIVNDANIVFLSNRVILERFQKRYDNLPKKFFMLPLCTDVTSIPQETLNGKVTLIHAGNLYGQRNINFINSAINQLKISTPNLSSFFQILLFGGISPSDRKTIMDSQNEDVIFVKGLIDRTSLYNEFSKADGLLVIDSLESDNVFLPSKLFEYFLFNKIIFSITPKVSSTRDYIEESGHFAFAKDEMDKFIGTMENIIRNRSCYNNKFRKDYHKYFLPETVVSTFSKLIAELTIFAFLLINGQW